jgi:deazaflavin-dependent oxidoreductase (nitroreductase family)
MIMPDYIPGPYGWVRDQVEKYESSGGTDGVTLMDTGYPCIIVYNIGNKSGGLRKTPLMRVKDGDAYILIGSQGGRPTHPSWVFNLRANPDVEIRDETEVIPMRAREVTDDAERDRLFQIGVDAFPNYGVYQTKTTRRIPVFLAEPR